MRRGDSRVAWLTAAIWACAMIPAAAQDDVVESSPPERHPGVDLRGPLRVQSRNMFNALHLVPELESTHVVRGGRFRIAGGVAYARTDVTRLRSDDRFVDFDAQLYQGWVEPAFGIGDAIQISARLSAGYLYQAHGDEILVFNGLAQQLDARVRDFDVERVVLGAKIEFLHADPVERRPGVAVTGHYKIPLASAHNLLDSGETDVAVGIHGSMPLGQWTLFLGGGYVWIGGENVFDPGVNASNIAHLGGGVNFEVVDGVHAILQVQGHSNAFHSLSPIDSAPLTVTGGVRSGWDCVQFEFYVGRGLGRGAPDFIAGISVEYSP